MSANRNEGDELNNVLREWVVDSALPPRFEENVWRRIDRTKARATQTFTVWLESLFNRPALAISYVAIRRVAGAMTGFLRVKDKSAVSEAQWRARYVRSIDPYQMPRE